MVIKFVIRNLQKRFLLNFLKILGLALGLSGILFITILLKNELSYDRYHSNAERIYRLTITNPVFLENSHFARIPNSEQVLQLAEYFPEIESYVRLAPIRGGVMLHNERFYRIQQGFECDSSFFELFDATLLIGENNAVLNAPGSMVISESFAAKVFGNDDPIGETISIPDGQYYGEQLDFTVKGVMKDFPRNSHFHPDLIATPVNRQFQGWAWVYLLLEEHTSPQKITEGYPSFFKEHSNQQAEQFEGMAYMQKLTDIHLHSDKLREIEPNGNMANIYVLAIAAVILLLISMSNYASLSIGMAGFYSKFIAINRVLGSRKFTNLRYFAFESLLILSASILLSAVISFPVNVYVTRNFNYSLFEGNATTIIILLLLFVLLGLISGLQPFFRQNFKSLMPAADNNFNKGKKVSANKGIIIAQFTFAIVLIAAVLFITRQTNYVLSNSMGASEDNIICFESVHVSIQQKFELFKAELLKFNTIESVSAMLEPPGGEANDMFPFEMEGRPLKEDQQADRIGVFPCDYSFANFFNLEFLAGSNFTEKNMDVEGSGEYLINETAMHFLGFSDPRDIVGKEFRLNFNSPEIEIPGGKIIGVVEDFHLSSMKKKVNPLVMFKRDSLWLINFVVAYKPGMKNEALSDIEKVWYDLFPSHPFVFEPLEAMYQQVYKTELLQARMLALFTFISLFICSMGLLGLSLLITQQRTKEIGIRKVNGAGSLQLLALLNKDYMKWVFLSFMLALPISWYAMQRWLEIFAYKTPLSWWIFALSGLLSMAIVLITVSWQSLRAAMKNPVQTLRYE